MITLPGSMKAWQLKELLMYYQHQLQFAYQTIALTVKTVWVVDHLTPILDAIEICVTLQTF